MSSKITITDVAKVYRARGRTVPALERVSLQVADGEFVCIAGPSGCGKSTLLRILAGLIPQTSGDVAIASGGRGLARAFANDPEVLLMDEPLGALDAQTRLILMDELLGPWESDRKTWRRRSGTPGWRTTEHRSS